MKKIKINDKWKFWEEKDAFTLVWGIPDEAGEVNLPYDPVISKKPKADSVNGFKTGYRDGGIYAYAKRIFVPQFAPASWSATARLCSCLGEMNQRH